MSDLKVLRRRFLSLCNKIGKGGEDAQRWANLLIAHYSEPHRHYHTPRHLMDLYEELGAVRHLLYCPDEVEMALWFHDVIYDPTRTNNEIKSIELLRRWGVELEIPEIHIIASETYIEATAGHQDRPVRDCGYFLDMDLSILGKSIRRFDTYDRAIREEYSFVPEEQYRVARAKVLGDLLARPSLYATPFFREKYDRRARANMTRAIARLLSPST